MYHLWWMTQAQLTVVIPRAQPCPINGLTPGRCDEGDWWKFCAAIHQDISLSVQSCCGRYWEKLCMFLWHPQCKPVAINILYYLNIVTSFDDLALTNTNTAHFAGIIRAPLKSFSSIRSGMGSPDCEVMRVEDLTTPTTVWCIHGDKGIFTNTVCSVGIADLTSHHLYKVITVDGRIKVTHT